MESNYSGGGEHTYSGIDSSGHHKLYGSRTILKDGPLPDPQWSLPPPSVPPFRGGQKPKWRMNKIKVREKKAGLVCRKTRKPFGLPKCEFVNLTPPSLPLFVLNTNCSNLTNKTACAVFSLTSFIRSISVIRVRK